MMVPRIDRRRDGSVELRFPYSPSFIALLKGSIPSEHRSWDPAVQNLPASAAYANTAVALMQMQFPGVVSHEGAAPPPPGPDPIRAVDRVYADLHLLPSAPRAVIDAAYKALARLNHPDTGGNAEAMKRLNNAYEALKARVAA
ncbi:MAG: J domain-containing protein [Chloroflexota bacterium]|nr:J domain-containing protein [Chloroflexota bacterium]